MRWHVKKHSSAFTKHSVLAQAMQTRSLLSTFSMETLAEAKLG